MNCLRNVRVMVSVGPLRCLAMMTSMVSPCWPGSASGRCSSMTVSASCSSDPLSLKSDSLGLWSCRSSEVRLTWEGDDRDLQLLGEELQPARDGGDQFLTA